MKRSMTLRSYLGWQRYWDKEPWGPWRDNVHTAILAREIRRGRVKPNTRIDMDQFMVRNPKERGLEAEGKVFAGLQSMAARVTPQEAMKRVKAMRANSRRRRSEKK